MCLLAHYLQISLWQHDSAYYDYASLFIKIKYEGRWLLPYLVYFFKQLNGQVVLFINLAALFVFFYYVAKQYTQKTTYAFVFACLCVQIPPIAYQMMWPANTAPAIIILMASAFVAHRLPLILFYLVFGVLLFATANNFYYLLPLVHLPLLSGQSFKKSLSITCFKIIPAWAAGFIVGYVVMLLMVYLFTHFNYGNGQWGIEIRQWRSPNKINNVADLYQNIHNSWHFLLQHLRYFLNDYWLIPVALLASLSRVLLERKQQLMAVSLIGISMVSVHYAITIPVGIKIDVRSVVATWIGLFAIVFLFSKEHRSPLKTQALMALMLLFTGSYYLENKSNLSSYANISNFYHDDFLNALPADYKNYKGVLFLSNNADVYHTNLAVLAEKGKGDGKIVWLNTDTRWAPNAYKAGFQQVYTCGTRHRHEAICQAVKANLAHLEAVAHNTPSDNINTLHGAYQGYLVMSLQHKKR